MKPKVSKEIKQVHNEYQNTLNNLFSENYTPSIEAALASFMIALSYYRDYFILNADKLNKAETEKVMQLDFVLFSYNNYCVAVSKGGKKAIEKAWLQLYQIVGVYLGHLLHGLYKKQIKEDLKTYETDI